jgi:hypothetical protein
MTYTGKTRAICQLATAVLSGASTIPAFGGNTTAKDRMSDPFAASGRLLIGGNGVMTPIQVTYTGYDGNNFTGVSGLAVDLPAGVYITQDFLVGVTGATTTTGYADNAVISAAGQNAFTGMRVDLDYANLWTNPPQRHSGADLLTFGRGWMLNGNPSWFERVVTVLSGQTAIVTAHGLLATPTWFTATPHADPGSGVRYWVTADATNVTVTISSAAGGSGLAFTVTAECTPTS